MKSSPHKVEDGVGRERKQRKRGKRREGRRRKGREGIQGGGVGKKGGILERERERGYRKERGKGDIGNEVLESSPHKKEDGEGEREDEGKRKKIRRTTG